MKPVAWLSVIVVAALCALTIFDGARSIPDISYAEVRRSVDGLDGHDGIEFIQTQNWKGGAELGTTLEKRLRDLLHVKQRRSSFRIEAHQFRDFAGGFSIKIYDKGREGVEVTIYLDAGILKPSKRTRDHLVAVFPHAHLQAESEDQ